MSYDYQAITGPQIRTHNLANTGTLAATVVLDVRGYNTVQIGHRVISGTAYTQVQLYRFDRTGGPGQSATYTRLVTHPAAVGDTAWGQNVKTSAQTSSYAHAFRGLTEKIGVGLNRTSGTHSVYVQLMNT